MNFKTPSHLADQVLAVLSQRESQQPPKEAITGLFEVMYCCSLLKEEAENLTFHVIYIDPENADPDPPPSILPDRWRLFKLDAPIELNLSNIRKLAPATDPRSSALAVYHDGTGCAVVYGFIDQLHSYDNFINMEGGGQMRPGIFEARILGAGHLAVNIGFKHIAELKICELAPPKIDVFAEGPIRAGLNRGISSLIKTLHDQHHLNHKTLKELAEDRWLSCLKRILLRMQNLGHGGSILVVPNDLPEGLNVKFRFRYDRLKTAIENNVVFLTQYQIFHEKREKTEIEEIRQWYIEKLFWEKPHGQQELKACIWFISLLTRIDGLVLISENLEVLGFGAVITESEQPLTIRKAINAAGDASCRESISYEHYGTRHQSMLRYCYKYPGSIGFVVSQDGDVRTITKLGEDVCIWEDVKLQLDIDFD